MTQAVVGRWGTDLAIRLPGDVASVAGLHDGAPVELEAHGGEIIIRRASTRATLAGLFAGKSPEAWRADYAGAFDWGPDVGREAAEG